MTGQNCTHCGEACGPVPVLHNDLPFCCTGCSSVYSILSEHKLYKYYELEQNPGIKADSEVYSGKYAYLDNEEIKTQLLDFEDGHVARVIFHIPLIHCSSCIWLLEHLKILDSGIIQSIVNFTKKEVSITFNPSEISLRKLVELLVSLHYIPVINLEKGKEKTSDYKSNRRLLYQIGVAGFAFGNIMLFSFPNYLNKGFIIEESLKTGFGWLSFLLSIPVVVFSGSDYFLSAFKALKRRSVNINLPIAIGIIALFLQSSFEFFTDHTTGYFDSLTGLIFYLLIGKWYQGRTWKALSFERDYKSWFPIAVSVVNDDESVDYKPLKFLKKNDHLLIRNQELIPADSILLSDTATIDYSFITGESTPVVKRKGDHIYAGGKQIGTAIKIEVIKEADQSRLTEIWNQDDGQSAQESKIVSVIDQISKSFTLIVLLTSAVTAIAWYFIDPQNILKPAIAVLIVACPCAIVLSIPFGLGNLLGRFGTIGFYLKNNSVIEKITHVDTIVFDKTGTLTDTSTSEVDYAGEKKLDDIKSFIKSLVKNSTHPASQSISNFLGEIPEVEVKNYKEIPFMGISGEIEGHKVKIGSANFVFGEEKTEYSGQSLVFVAINNEYAGRFELKNAFRVNLDHIINELAQTFELHLLSGDKDTEKLKFEKLFRNSENIHFNQSPSDKLNYIKKIQDSGRKVLMIGDGLNDAGALREAFTSISIAGNVYHFSPACDAILDARSFSFLPEILKTCHQGMRNISISFVISFIYNLAGISFAVRGLLSPVIAAMLMPASSVTVVAFVTAATTIVFLKRFKRIKK